MASNQSTNMAAPDQRQRDPGNLPSQGEVSSSSVQTESGTTEPQDRLDPHPDLPQCRMGTRKVDDMRFMISCTNWYWRCCRTDKTGHFPFEWVPNLVRDDRRSGDAAVSMLLKWDWFCLCILRNSYPIIYSLSSYHLLFLYLFSRCFYPKWLTSKDKRNHQKVVVYKCYDKSK